MLRPSELSALRRTMESSFADTCEILANVGTINGMGNQVKSWQATTAKPVPCRIVPQTGKDEQDVADKTTSAAEANILLPFDTVVSAANRIRIVGGATYEVNYRQPAQREDLSLLCDCKLVE